MTRFSPRRPARSVLLLLAVASVAAPGRAAAFEFFDGRLAIHGYAEEQIRALDADFENEWDLAQWRNILNLETEAELMQQPFGFIDDISAYARIEVSYDCVWTRACGLFQGANAYGDRAGSIPSYYTDGRKNGFVGDNRDPLINPVNPRVLYHTDELPAGPPGVENDLTGRPSGRTTLVGIEKFPGPEILARNVSFNETFAPVFRHRFAVHQLAKTSSNGDSSGIDTIVMPWRPKDAIDAVGTLRVVDNVTFDLPFRPAITDVPGRRGTAGGLYVPSYALRKLYREGNDFDRFDQNFSQNELEWNHGASQDEKELKEAYLDVNMLEGQLFLRLGKQTIVWGKTELFRNQDQFNPTDLALATLPALEESRIGQWAARAIWSLYDVGPLQDVRAELVWMLDDFEPTDIGRCGEPFSPLPVCRKTSQLFLHGLFGAGIVGERRPPDWWNSWKGNEVGARVEFRWSRFSFSVSDFWHWEDSAHPRIIQSFERRVDPFTGRPLSAAAGRDGSCGNGNVDVDGTGLDPDCLRPGDSGPNNALEFSPMNRQLFDVICRSSVDFFIATPGACALVFPNFGPVPGVLFQGNPVRATEAVGVVAGGTFAGFGVMFSLSGSTFPPFGFGQLVTLNRDPNDGPGAGLFGGDAVSAFLTDEQEALLGCGAFYGTNCDLDGIDLFNAEASVVFQSFPVVVPGTSVATRFVDGQTVILPGAHGPADLPNGLDPGWDPLVDGCTSSSDPDANCGAANDLIDPRTGLLFPSEMAALSYNALNLLVALDLGARNRGEPDVPAECGYPGDPTPGVGPQFCPTVQDFLSVTATTRPSLKAGANGRFGRRDFVWAGIGELLLEYQKVNTLGFAMDFAEDRSGTNWGMELTWTPNKIYRNSEVRNGLSKSDRFALTISVDRPTFVNFLNSNRTFLFNMQWFLEYLPQYVGGGHRGFEANGPFTQLGTFTIQTGYFQDRLQPSMTLVYDVQSKSGAVVFETRFRYTANATVAVGVNTFYGSAQAHETFLGVGALGESNQRHSTEKFERLNAVRERDEIYFRFRYTF